MRRRAAKPVTPALHNGATKAGPFIHWVLYRDYILDTGRTDGRKSPIRYGVFTQWLAEDGTFCSAVLPEGWEGTDLQALRATYPEALKDYERQQGEAMYEQAEYLRRRG